jgi:UDP-N-acetylmuramoyl-L-alanyl-D-glutamate--2,6-diaminopimelate ligase
VGHAVTLRELLADAPLAAPLDAGLAASTAGAVTADSREVRPGDVFFALPGARADGLSFAAAAAAAGAAAIIADKLPAAPLPVPVLLADTAQGGARAALAHAAARLHPRQPATTVAITGTSGKTSVAVFTRQIWA